MTSVTEIVKLDSDTNQLIFMEPYKWVSKTDDRFESSGASKLLNDIRLQNDWSELQLCQELEKRMMIIEWLKKKENVDFKEFGKIIAEYSKYPDEVFKRAQEEMKD